MKWMMGNCLISDGEGPIHHGVCSSWLNRIEAEEMVPCFVRGYKTLLLVCVILLHDGFYSLNGIHVIL